MDKLSTLKDFPTAEEITVEDFKQDKKRSVAGFEHLLEDSQKSEDSKKSWELAGSCDLSIHE